MAIYFKGWLKKCNYTDLLVSTLFGPGKILRSTPKGGSIRLNIIINIFTPREAQFPEEKFNFFNYAFTIQCKNFYLNYYYFFFIMTENHILFKRN